MTKPVSSTKIKNINISGLSTSGTPNTISTLFNKISNSHMFHFNRSKDITKLLRKQKKQERILIERTLNHLYKEAICHNDFLALKKAAEVAGFDETVVRGLVLIEYIEALLHTEDEYKEELERLKKYL
jgi:hypothetical protein